MHLEIKLTKLAPETVDSAVVNKLYDLYHNRQSGDTFDLLGYIKTGAIFRNVETELETAFQDLEIEPSEYYIVFADPEVESVLKTALNKAEGEGITTQEATSSTFGDAFQNNTDIVEFDEYKEFTTQKTNSTDVSFEGCTSLESIDLTGTTKMPRFEGCTSITYFNGRNSVAGTLTLSGTTWFPSASFRNVTTLLKITMTGYLDTGANAFWGTNVLEIYVDTLEHWLDCVFGTNGQPISNNTKLYINNVLLTDLVVPASINNLKGSLFRNYKQLLTITMHENVTVNVYTFEGCDNLTSIYIPTLTDWLSCTFNDNPLKYARNLYIGGSLVTSVTIPQGTNLKNKFWGSTSLTTVTLNSGITEIQESAFRLCTALISVTIPNTVTSIGNSAFESCIGLTSMTVPDGVTSIGNRAFLGCTNLTSITLPNSITSLGNEPFAQCRSLTSITFPQNITSIPWHAMYGCNNLTSVTIPSGVTSIGEYALYQCDSLSSIIIEATVPPTLGTRAFDVTNNCPIYVPQGSLSAYQSASGWSNYASRIQETPNS